MAHNARRMAGMSYTVGDRTGTVATVITSATLYRSLASPPNCTAVTGWQEAERLPRIKQLLQASAPGITLANLQACSVTTARATCAHTVRSWRRFAPSWRMWK